MTLLASIAAGALLLPAVALAAVQLPVDEPVPASASVPSAQTSAPKTTISAASDPDLVTSTGDVSRADMTIGREHSSTTTAFNQMESATRLEPTPAGRWAWPLAPRPQVVRHFEVGPAPWSPGHRGVDLVSGLITRTRTGTATGTPIRAPASGTVHFVGIIAGRPVLSIDHGGGFISSFEPVVSTLQRGQPVQRGEVIGKLSGGPTHCAPTACLHWGVRKDGRYINPLLLVPGWRGPAVLLPMLPP